MLTYDEIVRRLDGGEDPLDLFIEAWQQKVLWLEAGGDPRPLPIDWRHCPLCVHARARHRSNWCDHCAYYLHYGAACFFRDGPYSRIARILDGDPSQSIKQVLGLAREMVTELEAIRIFGGEMITAIIDRTTLIQFGATCPALDEFCQHYPDGLDISGLYGDLETRQRTWRMILADEWLRRWIAWGISVGLLPARIVIPASAGTDLSGACLYRANLHGAALHGAALYGANLHRADLSRAYLCGANLRWADLSKANLRRADLSKASLNQANLYGADLTGANLGEADLHGANLDEADLRNANLRKANLSGASLSGAYLCRADLSGTDLSEADLSDARWDEDTIWPEGFQPPKKETE